MVELNPDLSANSVDVDNTIELGLDLIASAMGNRIV